jgi:hypothetical protein
MNRAIVFPPINYIGLFGRLEHSHIPDPVAHPLGGFLLSLCGTPQHRLSCEGRNPVMLGREQQLLLESDSEREKFLTITV